MTATARETKTREDTGAIIVVDIEVIRSLLRNYVNLNAKKRCDGGREGGFI